MILDTAKVSLVDGSQKQAIEVFPGGEILCFMARKMARAKVLGRKIENRSDVICLILTNGQKLTGSRDQKVAVYRNSNVMFRPLADVEIGDHLRGEKDGMPVVVSVIGLSFDGNRPKRLVEFHLDHDKNFVAEGVLCRC